ncbi:NADH-quinone oxidoreductase subunit F [Candidatus Pacearchaeota archaeon]|nr:NADH-quinone oxidoreductase subunit F [Candidatus Pacearchaeota archaeon]
MQVLRETNLQGLALAKKLGKKGTLELLAKRGLVGRGGASFPTHKKWERALSVKTNERFLICNADEGEPGTFKDKFLIKNNSETLIEGILIAAFVLDAKRCFIYLRAEYDSLRLELEKIIKKVLKKSKMKVSIEIVRGAGAYVCGEETAIIQSIMGRRGQPMEKPPYPTIKGLWGKPTVLNNVTTLTCVPQALLYEDWNPNYRLFSISGEVEHPGVYEWELGVKMSTILGTVKPKGKMKAMSFGCFGGIMPVYKSNRVSPALICDKNCHHGAYSLIFVGEKKNIVDVNLSMAKFYTYESCGKCTPCREGTIRLVELLKKIKSGQATNKDLKLLKELANHIQETSLCGLGASCGNHILTGMKNFKKDYKGFIKKK